LAAALGAPAQGFALRHHAYVSADPSVDVMGTAFPKPAPERGFPEVGLSSIREAADSAHRGAEPRLQRRLFIRLALHQGWSDFALLSRYLTITPSCARRLAARGARDDLSAAALCLGDRRLTASPTIRFETSGWRRDPLTSRPRYGNLIS
jgi:hypothetical protein